jgi:tetratricopeptide (TPR) repeat protein
VSKLPDLAELAQMGDNGRERAGDPAAVTGALAEAERRLADGETAELRTYAGQAARLLGHHELAVRYLSRALELAPSPRARIRLGEAYRCADRLVDAERELRAALLDSQGTEDEHFALQHLGKTLADAGRPAEAATAFDRALALRTTAGDAELVASTEAALEQLRGQA